jgi:hypothetical protein
MVTYPLPSSTIPVKDVRLPAWIAISEENIICSRINALRINSSTFGTEWAFDNISLDRIDLKVDGVLLTEKGKIYPPLDFLGPVEKTIDDPFIPLDICWLWSEEPGLHVAEILINTNKGSLKFKWGFRVND